MSKGKYFPYQNNLEHEQTLGFLRGRINFYFEAKRDRCIVRKSSGCSSSLEYLLTILSCFKLLKGKQRALLYNINNKEDEDS